VKVVRNGVFETNSSSCHSLCISDQEAILDTLPVDNEGVVRIFTGEFGWGIDEYNDAAMKAAYCLTWIKTCNDENDPKVSKYEASLKGVIEEVCKAKEVRFIQETDKYYPWGYIDHQSSDRCAEAFESLTSLKNFIFNPNSTLRISNDNGGEDDDY
jgi:hypothetical protein